MPARKKIVMYFHKKKLKRDPFSKFGVKRPVYYYFFQKGKELGFEMYIASGKENYLGKMRFKDPYLFNGKDFAPAKGTVTADAVYDRSGGVSFPPKEIDRKILNQQNFKILCNDKNKMNKLLGDLMPKSFAIKNFSQMRSRLETFKKNDLVVVKPARGLCGKGIIIDKAQSITEERLEEKYFPYVLQEFVDTSFGIKNITSSRHDLRVIIVGGKIIMAHVRTPKKGSFLANVAQGGKIKEIPLQKLSKKVVEAVQKAQKRIDKKYNFPIYSIDFGIQRGRPYIFELNDQIGFPRATMRSYKKFIEGLLVSLEELSYNNI